MVGLDPQRVLEVRARGLFLAEGVACDTEVVEDFGWLVAAFQGAGERPGCGCVLSRRVLEKTTLVLDLSGEHDEELARELSKAGKGALQTVTTHRDVATALTRIFTT